MNRSAQHGRQGNLPLLQNDVSRRSLLRFAGLGAAVLGTAPLLAACGGSNAAAPGAEETVKFNVSTVPGDGFVIDAINAQNKDYAKRHLDVPKHIVPSSGVQGFQLLAAGAVEGMAADTLNLMVTHANSQKGQKPQLIGFRVMETTYGIARSKDGSWPSADASFVEKIKSLKGKKVGVPAIGSGGDLQLKLALEEAGLKYSDVTVLAVGLGAQAIPNMKANRIDAYVGVQWTTARYVAQETGGEVLVDFAEASAPDIIRNQAVVSIIANEKTIAEKPQAVNNWLLAQNDAREFMLNDKAGAAKILNDTALGGSGLEIATAYMEHYAADVAPKLQPMFKVPEDVVERMAEIGLRFGSIKKGDITYESLVPDFARA